jgi:CheY-like chemotaxis protein
VRWTGEVRSEKESLIVVRTRQNRGGALNKNLTILIIEDQENDVILLKAALSRAGIVNLIRVVRDGQEALDYLRGQGKYADRSNFPFPSIIFTDLKMPRVSGFDLLEWLREHPDCCSIPVVILTASRIDTDIRRAYRLGANAYLVKPSTLEDLQAMVKTACDFWAWCELPLAPGKC